MKHLIPLQEGKSPFSSSRQQESTQEQPSSKRKKKKRRSKEGTNSTEASSQSSGEEASGQQSKATRRNERLSNVSTGTSDEEITVNEPLDLQSTSTAPDAKQSVFGNEEVCSYELVLDTETPCCIKATAIWLLGTEAKKAPPCGSGKYFNKVN